MLTSLESRSRITAEQHHSIADVVRCVGDRGDTLNAISTIFLRCIAITLLYRQVRQLVHRDRSNRDVSSGRTRHAVDEGIPTLWAFRASEKMSFSLVD